MSYDATGSPADKSRLAHALSPALFAAINESADEKELLESMLPAIQTQLKAGYLGLAEAQTCQWQVQGEVGSAEALPLEKLAECLDSAQPQAADHWGVAPIILEGKLQRVLVMHGDGCGDADGIKSFTAVASMLGTALDIVRRPHQLRQRVTRLEAILEIAASWNQTLEMESLLTQMAETSTRLLSAQRASIFLWDRPNKLLVGRPALGIEGGELRIPDDQGIVGQVVQSGEPQRVDQDRDQQQINRQVDQQLGFQTQTLLCVPLCGESGRLLGAFEMINKVGGNFTTDDQEALVELAHHAAIALENTQQYQQLLASRNQMANEAAQHVQMIGESPALTALRSTVARVAATELAVLILGENGTGKEVIAQMVHYLSERRNEPIIAVNCAALSESLLESELFGHEKGAFTDAHETRPGKFEIASGGTLFLDEIGDLSLAGQAKLLRVLEEKTVIRVGGSTPIHTDARVIAATNQNLGDMVRRKAFREDLFYRLNVVTLDLPALRERGEDVLLLADHFLSEFCIKARRKAPRFTTSARKRLVTHSWPGNVRELRNLLERLAFLSQGDTITNDDLAFILPAGPSGTDLVSLDLPLTEATGDFQANYIRKHIEATGGNVSAAADNLGLHRSNLYRKMRQLGMETD